MTVKCKGVSEQVMRLKSNKVSIAASVCKIPTLILRDCHVMQAS